MGRSVKSRTSASKREDSEEADTLVFEASSCRGPQIQPSLHSQREEPRPPLGGIDASGRGNPAWTGSFAEMKWVPFKRMNSFSLMKSLNHGLRRV